MSLMKYGLLESGNKIQKGDEYFHPFQRKWIKVHVKYQGRKCQPGDWPIRRLLNNKGVE